MPWCLDEPHAGSRHARMIALEIIRLEEQEDPTSGLVTDACCLGRADRPRKQQARTAAASRAHDYPALAAAKGGVFAELEVESTGEEGDRFVIVRDHESNKGETLSHHELASNEL